MYDDNNVFAKILRGEIPAKKITEDEFSFSFYDITPKAKIHALVIPKGKYISFDDLITNGTDAEITGYMKAVKNTAEVLGLKQDGYRVVFNNGKNSGQEVPHLHAHILGGEALAF